MRKSFFKRLAFSLALAMVVTSCFACATPTSSATATKIVNKVGAQASQTAPTFPATATKIVNKGGAKASQTIYVGKEVNYSLNNVYSNNTYKWFTENEKIAPITQSGSVTPVAPGLTRIRCNAYRKATGKFLKGFTLDLQVQLRAASVSIIDAEDFELEVGEEKKLKAVMTPANSSDMLKYSSSNEKVATVDILTGVVTAVAPGEATIKAASEAAWFTSDAIAYNKYDQVKVTVVAPTVIVTADKTAFSLYDSKDDSVIITLTGKDQYGNEVPYDGEGISVEHISGIVRGHDRINTWNRTGLADNQVRFNLLRGSLSDRSTGLNIFKVKFLDKVVMVYVNIYHVTDPTL